MGKWISEEYKIHAKKCNIMKERVIVKNNINIILSTLGAYKTSTL